MKTKFKILFTSICIFLLIVSIQGCRKSCRQGKLLKMEAEDGYSKLSSAEIAGEGYIRGGRDNSDIIISNTAVYDSIFNSQRPCGNVDFNAKVVLACSRYVNPNDGISANSNVFINNSIPQIKFRGSYSLHGQCKGSGIQSGHVIFYATIPKTFSTYQMVFDIRDANPH